MNYQTPQLSLVGSAQSLVLGQCDATTPLTRKFVDTSGGELSRDIKEW